MTRFDWPAFLAQHHIPFVTQGPNTARNHISIRCPYCGNADKSQHMGLSLDKGAPLWGCFRNARHRGGNPRRLIQKLLGVSFQEAIRLVAEQQEGSADTGDLERTLAALRGELLEDVPMDVPANLHLPRECKPIVPPQGYAMKFLTYLADPDPKGRGFGSYAADVCKVYELHYAVVGDQAWRVVFPIRDGDGNMVGWTGREIRPSAERRYHSSSLPQEALFNHQNAVRSQGDTLVIVEGPMDATKVDFFGAHLGVSAVATLGTALPPPRRAVLSLLAAKFDRCALLFDEDTLPEVLSIAPELSEVIGRSVEIWRPGEDDAGKMPPAEIQQFLKHQMGV